MSVLRMPEDDLRAGITEAAELQGWLVYHIRKSHKVVQSHTGKGFPDIVLAHPEYGCAFVELKGTGGRIESDQRKWLNTLADNEIWVAVWWPIHYDAALAWLANPIGRTQRKPIPGRWMPE